MSAGGEGGSGGDDGDDDEAESFASLLSDTKRLARGPARRPPTSGIRRGPRVPGSDEGDSASSRFRWPDANDRHRGAAEGVTDSQLFALSRGEPEPLERIDLHGTRRELAGRLLTKRLESARAQGHECVLVIHGRGHHSAAGEAILRDALPDWLTRGANARHVLAFAPAPERLGGLGATLVLLRRH